MEKFYLEEPSLERMNDVKEYIEDHFLYNSNIAGDSGLEEEYLNYESFTSANNPNDVRISAQYAY